MNKIYICITTNIKYLKYASSFIESLYCHINHKYYYDLHILLDTEIDEYNQKKLSKQNNNHNFNIYFHKFDESVFLGYESIKTRSNGQIGNFTYYYRRFIDRYIDSDKVIYFDTDMLINGDISSLWETDLGDKLLGAVKDIYYEDSELYKYYNISPCFNSGMLLINLKKWGKDNISKKCLEFKKQHLKLTHFFDQDTLNIIAKDKRMCLSPKFNYLTHDMGSKRVVQYTEDEYKETKTPIVIHFAGPHHRPRAGLFCTHEYVYLYFKYLFKSKYFEYKDYFLFLQRIVTSNTISRKLLIFLLNLLNL